MNFLNNLNNFQKGLIMLILAVIFYAASASISFSYFNGGAVSNLLPRNDNIAQNIPTPKAIDDEDPAAPHDQECPLDGVMHTQKAKDAWGNRLPLAIMVENHEESRPQSGLSSADIVYETVAEGGITRFMAVFYCNYPDVQVGPVRSARTYFLDWASEYGLKGALYAHVGGANTPGPADALGQIITYKMLNLNQFSIGYPTFWRDYQRLGHPVATEHTMYSTTYKLWEAAIKKGYIASNSATLNWVTSFTPWKFKADSPGTGPTKITVNFWEGYANATVDWNYDQACNCYKRDNGGQPHKDLNTGKQIEAKNIVVRFMVQSNANDGYENNVHLLYTNKGQGKALIFRDGKVIEGTWTKASRTAREKFLDENGKEISFNRGTIWLQAVPTGAKVIY